MRIGINTFLFTSPFTSQSTRVFRKLKDWGFDTVEIAVEETADFDAGHVRREADKAGIVCGSVCAVIPSERDLRGTARQQRTGIKYIKECVDIAVALGARTVIGPLYSAVGRADAVPRVEYRKQWQTVVKNLRIVGKYAEATDRLLCLEPLNRFETDFINTCAQVLKLVKAVNNPAVRVMLDTFHMNIEEKHQPAAIRLAGKHLGHLHACGCDRGTPGNDHIDWKGIAEALRDIGYSGDVVIESFTQQVAMIAKAAAIWRKMEPSPNDIATNGLSFLRKTLGR